MVVISSIMKNFFVQKPHASSLIPFVQQATSGTTHSTLEEYMWEQNPDDIIELLAQQYIDANLQYLLFQSLMAEHAARFISMDSSTRNAQNLLDTTKLDYNKLRQAKITKELNELSGSFT